MKRTKLMPTTLQARQRELSWALFITEGYIANMLHAIAVNTYTLDRRGLAALHNACRQAEATARHLRMEMQ